MCTEIDYERLLYKAAWALSDLYYRECIENGMEDREADRMADEFVCDVLDISIGEYADIIEMF